MAQQKYPENAKMCIEIKRQKLERKKAELAEDVDDKRRADPNFNVFDSRAKVRGNPQNF